MMYACSACKNSFEEEELEPVYQWDGEGVMGGWHAVEAKCPYCGSTDDWGEAEDCCVCGEYFVAEDDMINVDGVWFCKACAEQIAATFVNDYGMTEELKISLERREERLRKIRA